MRKKFTMLLASLFLVMGTAWAENVLFNTNSTTALPGTLENSQYTWKSSEMTAPDGFTTLRLTFMKTTNNAMDPGGHPHVNIAEFYLYDKDGNTVTLTSDRFSSNATETNEGKSGLHRLCDGTYTKQEGDGNNDWYWHSFWSSNPGAYHYLEINVADVGADFSTFAVGYVTRQENGSPTELLVTTGSSTEDVAEQCPNVTVTYNHLLGGVSKRTEELDAVVGASYPAPSLPWGVEVVTDLSGTVTEGGNKDIEVAYNGELPFTPSASFETAHWYYLRFTKDARYIRYNETDTYIPTDLDKIYPNVDPEAYAWAFVGDPYTGEYKLMNRKAGSTKVLSSTRNIYDGNTGGNTCPLMKEESGINETTDNKTWIVTKSTSIAGVNGMFIGLKTSNNETKYMNSRSSKLAFWTGGEGDGSTFQTEEFSYKPAFDVAKEEALNSLQPLAAISDKTEAAKAAIEALNPTTSDEALAAFTALNEQMNSVVSGVYFTLQNKSNTNIYLTTDGTNASATTTADIKAYWTLKNKNGLFYLYNKYNNAYLQRVPTSNETKITITSQDNLAAAYRAVLPASENNVWALTSFESAGINDTKFLHKAGDNRIVRWDAKSSTTASHWTITEVDYATAFSALVEEQLDGKVFSDNPALGEYPTSAKDAFDALKAAYLANPTDENELALVNGIDELEKAKNRPVFTINGAGKDYAIGKSVYDDNDGAPAFKTTDVYDKTMWWALDQVETTVSATGSDYIGIYNVGTGNGFWGQSSIKIAATSDAKEGVFLFYTPESGSTVHFQQNGSTMVYYNSTGSDSGSATSFTYLGNSYDLSKLTDEKIAALQALKTAVDEKSYLSLLELGTGVGQYNMTGEEWNAYVAPIYEADALVGADLTQQAEVEVSVIDAHTAAVREMALPPAEKLNLPTVGKYYRIKGANAGAENYVTGYLRTAGDRIALQAEANGATVFQYLTKDNGDGILLAVENNLYLALNSWTFKLKKADAAKTEFAASTRKAGAYTIKSGGSYFHYDNGFLNRCGDDADHTAHDWCLEEVAESDVPANNNLLTDSNNLSAEASYRIYGDRGFIYVADGALKSTYNASAAYNPRSENHHFAVVTIGGNKYLYNVGAKKFVAKSGNTVTLTDYPEHAITVEAAAEQSTDYDWVISLNGSKLNQSAGSGHAYGIFTNHNEEDEGNRWALYKVDTFNPAEASSIKKVTVNYNVEGQTFTKNYGVAAGNAISFDYDFATVTSCKVGEEEQTITDGACSVTVLENMTIAVVIDETLPFEAARAENNIPASAWLYLQMHSNNKKYIEYLSDNQKIEWADASVEREGVNTHSWALVGNVVEGFKLVNYAATSSKALKSIGSGNPAMDSYANGTAFVLANTTQSVDGGFCLQYPGGNYLNAGATLQHWGSADAGSTLVATKSPAKLLEELNTLLAYAATVVTIENDNTAALTTAKETAQGIYDATIQYSEEIEGAYEPLNTAIDNVIKAEVDSRLFRLKHSASNLYMTIVTPEAAAGIKIMGKAVDATKQAFYIAATENLGVYNIKSTENYFMASSGAWNYGAYEAANENGRAHNVEYLGEGKYALKTLNGYAGTNDGAITAESPLYSNHPKTRTTIQWELEELPKSSITYIYKYGEEEITREVHENVYEGLAAPATAVTLPFGFSYDNAALPTTKGAGNQNVEIPCTLSLPFEYASEYAAITKWYYLKIHATDQNYLYYDSNNAAQLDATKKEVDATNKDAYTWAFIGDPIHGFQVVNKLSTEGNLLYLNATETKPSVGTETHVWALTSSTYDTDGFGFFMACSTEGAASAERLNKNQSEGIVKYWDGADGGSTFLVEERDLSGASELQEYINNVVNPLLTELGDGTATAVGYVTKDSYDELVAAKALAQAAVDSRENVNEVQIALQEAVHGLKTIQPTAGTYYFIQNTQTNAYMSVVAGTGLVSSANAGLGELFQFVAAADGKFYLYNVERGTYLSTAKLHGGGQNFAGAVETTSAKAVTITNLGATNEVSIIPDGGATMHHDSNQGTIVGWNGEKGSKSSWKIVEADLTNLTREVTIGSTGYSTLYLNYATIVPAIEGEDNGVYVASEVASNYVALTLVEAGDVLPANTGVIIKAAAGTYNFDYTSEEGSVTSAFMGSSYNKYITPEDGTTCYVLAKPTVEEGEEEKPVGLYRASKNRDANGNKVNEGGVAFLNNANKVYLPVSVAEPQAAQALAFRFRGKEEGTTEIEVPATNDLQPAVIYDLTGRRIEKIVEKGIYIVNGRKVVIK